MAKGIASSPETSRRFVLLDVLRGLASLSVVTWHWQHFLPEYTPRSAQPFFDLLRPFYTHGDLAVDLFFVLSGFIFFALYQQRIANRKTSAREFFWLRFSRLYPLHFATLLGAAALQHYHREFLGDYFVYQTNDARQFFLHLLFASSWHPHSPNSFNGPVWSVSIEILLYAAFFLTCRFRLTGLSRILSMALLGAALSLGFSSLGRGIFGFYAGGLCWRLVFETERHGSTVRVIQLAALSIAATLGLLYLGAHELTANTLASQFSATLPYLATRREVMVGLIGDWLLRTCVFPAGVVLLALSEQKVRNWVHPLSWVGNITYSSYLLHFPLQIALVLGAHALGMSLNFESKLLFLAFMASLIVLSVLTYRYFELPVQKYLRSRQLGRSRRDAQPVPSA